MEFEDFELDGIDLPMDAQDIGTLSSSITEPHLTFLGKSFVKFLSLAHSFRWNSGKDLVSKSVSLTASGGKLVCRATDLGSYLEYEIDLIDTSNVLERPLIIASDLLVKLVKAAQQTIIIKELDGQLYFQIAGGWIPMETLFLNENTFICPDKFTSIGSMNAVEYSDALTRFIPFIQSAMIPSDRCIKFEEDKAVASYMWAHTVLRGSFVKSILKLRDAIFMRALLSDSAEDIRVGRTTGEVSRLVYEGEGFRYYNLESSLDYDEVSISSPESSISVDYNQVVKLVTLSSELPSSLGKVGLSYDKTLFFKFKESSR